MHAPQGGGECGWQVVKKEEEGEFRQKREGGMVRWVSSTGSSRRAASEAEQATGTSVSGVGAASAPGSGKAHPGGGPGRNCRGHGVRRKK